MRKLSFLLVALAACGAASSSSRSASPPPVEAPEVPPPRPAVFSDIRSEVAPLDETDAIPPALRIANLQTTALPDGDRELRVWSGLVVGYPHDGLVLRVHDGVATGKLVRYWPVNDSSFDREPQPGEDRLDMEAQYAYHETGRCESIQRGPEAVACFVRLRREPEWGAVLAALDSANAWTLPDESGLKRRGITIDGWRLRVEARRGSDYRRYQYTNPQYVQPPEGQHAHRIGFLLDSLMYHFARSSSAYRTFRGHYAIGRDTSDFVGCEGGTPAFMTVERAELLAMLGDSATRARNPGTRRFYVEGRGTLGPERRQRRGSRIYQRSWAVDTITLSRAPGEGDCR